MINKLSHFINLNILNEEDIPTQIKLFDVGENHTSQGTFVYDPNMSEQMAHPNGWDLLAVDIDHLSFSEQTTPELKGSFGWYKLLCNDEGIFATDIQWSDRIKPLLLDRAYRFVSPAFNCIDNTNIISEVINFALTNIPATINMKPFIATKDLKNNMANKKSIKLSEETETPEEDKTSEEKKETETLTTPEEQSVVDELSLQLEAANARIAELEKEIADYSAAMDEEEKVEELTKLNISDAEVKFLSKMSLEDIKELVQIRLSSKNVPTQKLAEKETLKHKFLTRKNIVPGIITESDANASTSQEFETSLKAHVLSLRERAQKEAAKYSYKK